MTTPVFETWKKNNPNCEVHVLCKTITAPIIKNNPNVDKIFLYEPSWMNKRPEDKKISLFDLFKNLKKEKYDLVFEMHGDPRNNILASIIGKYSIGYGCRGAGFLLNKTILYDTRIHTIQRNLDLIKPYCSKLSHNMKIYTDAKSKKSLKKIMEKYDLAKNKFLIINPFSGRSDKNLNQKEVNNFIKEFKKYTIIITGSQSERYRNSTISKQYRKDVMKTKIEKHDVRIINLSGETDLLTLTELVKNARLVIAPDTAIIHIAKSTNTPFQAIYKSTNKKVWGY
ncbi:MAG: glycosyltransferase family 9 protein [Candidatus Woesearchaeota archaeon]